MQSFPGYSARSRGAWPFALLSSLIGGLLLGAVLLPGTSARADGNSWPPTILAQETLDECIMQCDRSRNSCRRSCSDQFDACIARAGGTDDGTCGAFYRTCYAGCDEGFSSCVTDGCYPRF